MLQKIRDKSSGWIAFVILGLIIIAMAFFGLESYFAPKIETYAAKITSPPKYDVLGFTWGRTSVEVSQNEFRERYEQARREQRDRLGDAFSSEEFESLDNKRVILDELVDQALLGMAAEEAGIRVGDAAVAAQLKRLPEFQEDGRYSEDRYRLALASQGMTHAQFMATMRADMARRTIPSQVATSALASPSELDRFLALSQQKRDLQLLEIPPPSFTGELPDEAELRAWYEQNASRYRSEEQVAIQYVEIDGNSLDVPVQADEATLRGRYEQLRARYVTEPSYVASHIQVSVAADADDAAVEAAREKAAVLAAQAREPGADFAALAAEHSDDLGSKADGGDLGPVTPGVFDPAFEAALFALEEGGVSDPVRTADGWHVIKLRELVPGSQKPFEEVRAEIEAEYLETERDRAFSDLAGQLIDRVYKDPTALAPAAESLGLTLQETGLFGRQGGPGIAALDNVRRAAFSDAQKIERQVSDTIEIGPNHVVVLQVTDHKPEATRAFEDVQAQVRSDFMAERLATAARERAEALLAKAREGAGKDALAEEVGRQLASQEGVTRRGTALPPAVLDKAFALSVEGGEGEQVAIAQVTPDRYMMVWVTAVRDGDPAELDEQTRELLLGQFSQARGALEYLEYVKALRARYTVVVAEDRL